MKLLVGAYARWPAWVMRSWRQGYGKRSPLASRNPGGRRPGRKESREKTMEKSVAALAMPWHSFSGDIREWDKVWSQPY